MRATLLIGLVTVACTAAAPNSKDKDPAPKQSPLIGEWELVSSTTLGKTNSWELGGFYVFTADGKWSTPQERGDKAPWHQYTADDKADPKTLNIIVTDLEKKGSVATWRWLYRIDGDTLDICWRPDDPTVRPKEFEAGAASKNAIYTLKKMKPKK